MAWLTKEEFDRLKFFVQEVDIKTKEYTRFFIVSMSTNREVKSYDAFWRGKNHRWKNKKGGKMYFQHNIEETMFRVAPYGSTFSGWTLEDMKRDTCIKCPSIYDFYKYIGYNRLKRRYD